MARGLSVTVFESRSKIGGIWTNEDSPVFDNLTTNTACFETCYSDVPPLRVDPKPTLTEHDNLCLTRGEFAEYLGSVVNRTPGLAARIRFGTDVLTVRSCDGGYRVESASKEAPRGDDGEQISSVDFFDYVVIASGAHNVPAMLSGESLPGLDTFPGSILHVETYKKPAQFRGKRVLVVGGSISGCEAAGDMAMASPDDRPASVTLSTRRMRHLVAKQSNGRLVVSQISTRFHMFHFLAGTLWSEKYITFVERLLHSFSVNEEYNAPPPEGPVYVPGVPNWVPVNDKCLMASKTGRLKWNAGGISCVKEDGTVCFQNGETCQADVIMFATGYYNRFPFLDEDTKKLILAEEAPDYFLDLANFTLHPQLPRLAFVSLYPPGSAVAPLSEAQARWIAKVIADPSSRPSDNELWAAIAKYRAQRTSDKAHIVVYGFEILDRLARLGGYEIDLSVHKEWTKALIVGPIVPAQFRLFGEGKLENALTELERQLTAAGHKKGDNVMEEALLRELQELCTCMMRNGSCPKGLPEAVKYLFEVNGVNF